MTRQPWEITREMFLSVPDVERLLTQVRVQVRTAPPADEPAAGLDQVIIESLLFSGLRNSEFCSLRVADSPAGHGRRRFEVRSENRENRTVHVPEHLRRLICRYVQAVRPFFLPESVDGADPNQPLIYNEHRRPYERTGLYRRVVRILSACGLEDRASVQLLRHTYGYLAYLRTGGNLLFVQRQLGHAHPMVTSVYAQFVDESYEDLAEKVYEVDTSRRGTDSSGRGSPPTTETSHENDERSAPGRPADRRRNPRARSGGGDPHRPLL